MHGPEYPVGGKRAGCHAEEGVGLQGVAGEDGRGLVKSFVIGGTAAAQIVIVHGRKVIVDEGIGMHHLYTAGKGQNIFRIRPEKRGRGKAEHGPQTLASGKETVKHGLPEAFRRPRVGNAAPEVLFNEFSAFGQMSLHCLCVHFFPAPVSA